MDRQLTSDESELAIPTLVDAQINLTSALPHVPKALQVSIEATLSQIKEVLTSVRERGVPVG